MELSSDFVHHLGVIVEWFWAVIHSPFFLLVPVLHTLGALHAIQAILRARTSQGAIAWAISLVTFPYLVVPLFWIFGRNKFNGYIEAMRSYDPERLAHIRAALEPIWQYKQPISSAYQELQRALEALAPMPFTRGNEIELLINGQATFSAIFAGIDRAQFYILVQFYILRDDRIGRELQQRLIRRAREGVRIFVLYDEIGSLELSRAYVQELEQAGVAIRPFHTRKGRANRFQLNFRNHRKIVIVDGVEGFVGGHNVGDEYLGLSPQLGAWRDTHVRLAGPAVQGLQVAFGMDWYWAAGQPLGLQWAPRVSPAGDSCAIVLPTSPADTLETAELFLLAMIQAGKKRVWIASPYFVPGDSIISALQLAATSGVDVRILVPQRPDNLLVYFASHAFFKPVIESGVKIYQYQEGFLHQKVMLVDDQIACVGTKNLDNRSMHLNFEVSLVVHDPGVARQVEEMFGADFERSHILSIQEMEERGFLFHLWVQLAKLLAPVL